MPQLSQFGSSADDSAEADDVLEDTAKSTSLHAFNLAEFTKEIVVGRAMLACPPSPAATIPMPVNRLGASISAI
jgi:hypothetical protein